MFEPATTRASPDLAAKAERRRQKFALKEWEGSATRAAHDARVRSAKSQYADLFHANGNTPGARRGASPAGAPATPAAGSYADTEMARRARRTPPSNARLARTPKTPESARVASRANGADASGGRNLDAALFASPPREAPGSRIRAAAAVALSPDSKYRAEVFGERAGETEASPGARRGVDRGGGEAEGGSPLGPESSLGGSRLARRGSSRSPASRLPSPPVTRGALRDVSNAPKSGLVESELATPEAARADSAPRPGSSARPSTGRNLARFLKRRQALRRAEAEKEKAEKDDGPAERDADKENVDPAWAEYEACPATKASPGSRTQKSADAVKTSAPRAPLAPLAMDDGKENLQPLFTILPRSPEVETLGAFIERATAEAEAEAEAASARALAFSGYSDKASPPARAGAGRRDAFDENEFAPREPPFFVRDDDEDAYPPTPAESPSPLRSANAETHAAWIKQGYGAIRASAAAAAPRYAEEDEPESETGRGGDEDDAWNEYALPDSATFGGFDEARVEPFKMVSPGVLRRAAAETARSASLVRYA